jgi:hypothetical protein
MSLCHLDIKAKLEKICIGNVACKMKANNNAFGGSDPCMFIPKYARVTYRCAVE